MILKSATLERYEFKDFDETFINQIESAIFARYLMGTN